MVESPYVEAVRRKYPEPVTLVVSWDAANNRANIITLGWAMVTSHKPPMFAVSVGLTRHSYKTIRESGEFVVAFPTEGQEEAAFFCGSHTGRDFDKLAVSGFKSLPAKLVKPPLILRARANFECKLADMIHTGDHAIFVGEVVASHVGENAGCRLFIMEDGKLRGLAPFCT